MRKIKVLRLIARMNVGGPAIQISGLMRGLPFESFEQKLVTGFCDENEADYLDINELKISHTKIDGFGRSVNLFSDLKVLFAIRREIKALILTSSILTLLKLDSLAELHRLLF